MSVTEFRLLFGIKHNQDKQEISFTTMIAMQMLVNKKKVKKKLKHTNFFIFITQCDFSIIVSNRYYRRESYS